VAVGGDARRPAADKPGAHLPCPVEEAVEALAVGADVHVEGGDVRHAVVDGLEGVLDGVHAAEARAVAEVALVARANAQDEQDALWMVPVGGLDDLAAGGSGGGQQPLELERGEDVRVRAVAELAQRRRVEHVEAGGDDDRCHPALDRLLQGLHEVDALGWADLDAALTGQHVRQVVQTLARVDYVRPRYGLGERRVDCLARRHARVELVGQDDRADDCALAAARAFTRDQPIALMNDGVEGPHLALELSNLRVREDFDVRVLADFGELWRLDADGAVERREVLVERGHLAAERRRALDEDHSRPRLGEIERRLNARDATADDEDAVAHATASWCLAAS